MRIRVDPELTTWNLAVCICICISVEETIAVGCAVDIAIAVDISVDGLVVDSWPDWALVVGPVFIPAHRERPCELSRIEVLFGVDKFRHPVCLLRADDLKAVIPSRDGPVDGNTHEVARHAQM